MHPRPQGPRFVDICILTVTLVVVLAGCGTSPIPGNQSASQFRPDLPTGEMPPVQGTVVEQGDDNNLFDQAQPATLPPAGEIVIEGTIANRSDVDLYYLGAAVAGDRVVIDVTGHDGLNTVAALFDAGADLIDANDDRSYYAGQLNPYVSQVIQVDTPNLFVGVAVSSSQYFASSAGRYDSGSYSAKVSRTPNVAVRSARQQIVYLNFNGGQSVRIAMEPVETMRPFSAESISNRLAGQTEYIIGLTIEQMRRDFARFDVVLLDGRIDARPAAQHSNLFFGNYNAAYLGLADSVDTGNAALEQEAIIYAEDLAMFESLWPSAEETAQALANIASHELGHLLGLEHTEEAADLMATASSARQILETDAEFIRAGLQHGVFPVGWQSNPVVLLANVGGNSFYSARLRLEDMTPAAPPSFRDELGLDIPIVQCRQCSESHEGG